MLRSIQLAGQRPSTISHPSQTHPRSPQEAYSSRSATLTEFCLPFLTIKISRYQDIVFFLCASLGESGSGSWSGSWSRSEYWLISYGSLWSRYQGDCSPKSVCSPWLLAFQEARVRRLDGRQRPCLSRFVKHGTLIRSTP